MKILEELKILREESSYLTLGVLIIEDILILSVFAILQSTSVSGTFSLTEIILPIGLTIAFIAVVLIVGSKIIPKLVDFVARTNQSDVLVVTVLGLAFGFAYISNIMGISVAVGAFFAGINCRIKISFGYQYSYNSNQGYVCSIILCIRWCINEHRGNTCFHNTITNLNYHYLISKIHHSFSSITIPEI